MTPLPESDPRLRWQVYGLLITLAAGLTAGRIASVERLHEPSVHKAAGSPVPRPAWPASRPEPSPTFSSNDRSRWAAARALVEQGTFVIGRRVHHDPPLNGARYTDEGIVFEDGFQTVDKVLNPQTQEFFSTKPPLLTLVMAAEYAVLKNALGWTMAMPEQASQQERERILENRFHVTRVALVLFNLIPLIAYLVVLAWLAERFAASDWSRYFLVAAGGFATLVTPFLITINNHTPATLAAAILLYAMTRIHDTSGENGWAFGLGGLAGGLLICLEQPALAMTAGVFAYLAWFYPVRSLMFLAAGVVPVALAVGVNAGTLGEWSISGAYGRFGTEWYQYEGSHWVPPGVTKRGIDFARRNGETREMYAFHLLLGHHGVFSLMPVMLLAVAGMAASAVRGLRGGASAPRARSGVASAPRARSGVASAPREGDSHGALLHPRSPITLLGIFSLLVSTVVLAFYLYKSDNYGGWSNGPRWLMWLAPLWLVSMLPVLDVLAKSRPGRLFALTLLLLSILSMSYQNWNPWRHPWIYNWMESRGWISY